MRVAVIGAGYVGLVSGLVHWELGHEVLFVEVDEARCAWLRAGEAPFREPGVDELLRQALASGRVRFDTSYDGVADVEVALVCVPTPVLANGGTDTRALEAVSRELEWVGARSVTLSGVFVRSSCVPGTTRAVFGVTLRGAPNIDVGVLPEFLREGAALVDQRHPDRLVVGTESATLRGLARRLYPATEAPFLDTTLETAELVKLTNNVLLGACISLANEIACIAEHVPGVDADVVFAGVHLDRRLHGPAQAAIADYLKPGAGFGGSCLGKDLRALATFARECGETPRMLDAIHAVNDAQPTRLVARLHDEVGGLQGKRVLVLGLAFKPGTDDVRGTIAGPIVADLVARGASVVVHDPAASETFCAALPAAERVNVTRIDDWRSALGGPDADADSGTDTDALILVTAWPEYLTSLPPILRRYQGALVVADGRSALRGVSLAPDVRYLGVGLGPVAHEADQDDAGESSRSS